MPLPAIVPIVAPAAVTGIASLFGAKKSSNAAKDSARIQTNFSQKALDEQRRIYDIERADEQRQRSARAGIFDQYGTNPGSFQGNLPNPYGMDDAQTATMRGGNASQGAGASKSLPPSQPQPGERTMPVGPQGGGRPTVTLQAPTGEILDVDVDQVPALLQKGAIMLPQGHRQNASGASYGMV